MFELNKVFVAGNLTRDPEVKYLPGGTALAQLGLAVNRRSGKGDDKKDETVFLDVTVWEKSAEFCKNYLHKGSAVIIEGRLKQEVWQDKTTGANRSKIGVVAERVQFADSKRDGEVQTEAATTPTTSPAQGADDESDCPF